MQCKHCGAEVGAEYRLCPYCKSEMDYPKPSQQPVIIQNIIQQPMNTQDYNNYNQGYNQNYNQVYNQNYNQVYNQNYNQGYNQNYNQPPQQNYNNGYQAPYQSQPAPYQNNNNVVNNNNLAQVSPKSKVATLILAIFLGWLGIHRFYAGRYISGAVYLFTYGVFYCGWILDIILIIMNKFKDKDGLPIQK